MLCKCGLMLVMRCLSVCVYVCACVGHVRTFCQNELIYFWFFLPHRSSFLSESVKLALLFQAECVCLTRLFFWDLTVVQLLWAQAYMTHLIEVCVCVSTQYLENYRIADIICFLLGRHVEWRKSGTSLHVKITMWFVCWFEAATKKQKYEKISEKKMSTPVEILCKVWRPSRGLWYWLQTSNISMMVQRLHESSCVHAPNSLSPWTFASRPTWEYSESN